MSLAAQLRERAPHLFLALRMLRYGLRPERLDAETASVVRALCGPELRVLSGPFAGMGYIPFASGSGLLPKLVGSYELEIHPALDAAIERGYRRVINIGCGEGYYAVGFARCLPEAQIHAFDTDIVARQRARQLARQNGVAERVLVRGLCHTANLRHLAGSGALILCDCEGCEIRLLDPLRVPELAATDLLVELHDFLDPTISTTILERFRPTHRITIFSMADRSSLRLPQLEALGSKERERALWEGRPEGMQWAWLEAREPEARG